jgi:hypothetical protein
MPSGSCPPDPRYITTRREIDRAVTEQLEPERARSCRNAITMASVMVDEIRLQAHARPLEETPGDIATHPSEDR